MVTQAPFASQVNFLDPQYTEEGKLYAPLRYKQLVRERFLIAHNCNTSYVDVGKITPTEKVYLLEIIEESANKNKELIENLSNKR